MLGRVQLCGHAKGLRLAEALHVVQCSAFSVFKFFILPEQGASFISAYTDLVSKAVKHF